MTAAAGSSDRHVVPRWRSVPRSVAAGEFQRLAIARELTPRHEGELQEYLARWVQERSPLAAAELVGAALVAGVADIAVEAAETLENDDNPFYRALSRSIKGATREAPDKRTRDSLSSNQLALEFYRKVAQAKSRIIRDPRNAIAWSDLARRYLVLGELSRAQRALSVARSLSPTSRYLLRAEARFLLHIGHPDHALDVLSRSPRTKEDPWLMAAALSVAASGRLPIRGVRDAKRILERGAYRQIELSDLRSELGTLELGAGAERRARVLFEASLSSPTDNSLAQVEWASHRLPSLEVSFDVEVPFPAEALSRAAAQAGDWDGALEHGIQWIDDQPFDSQAAIHASYVAAVGLDDWNSSRVVAEIGLRANPLEPTLLNNLAYALIELGDLDGAGDLLAKAPMKGGDPGARVAIEATRGLLAFRTGDWLQGRRLYRNAIERAKRAGNAEAEAMARSMLLREEVVLGLTDSESSPESLLRVRQLVKDPGVLRCLVRALRLAGLAAPE